MIFLLLRQSFFDNLYDYLSQVILPDDILNLIVFLHI